MDMQEWPEEHYPPYANGPGYIVSSDIAQYIVSDFETHKLRVSLICLKSISCHWELMCGLCLSYLKWKMLAWERGSKNTTAQGPSITCTA